MVAVLALLVGMTAAPLVAAWTLPSSLNPFFRAPKTGFVMPTIMETHNDWANATCYAYVTSSMDTRKTRPGLTNRPNSDLYADDRILPYTTNPPLNSSNMAVETCLDHYESLGSVFAGLEYGQECYCGDETPNGYWINDMTECDHPCSGSMTQ